MITLPLIVEGKDSKGQSFDNSARTLTINRHGARIVTPRPLRAGQTITVTNLASRKKCKFRVVGPVSPATDRGGEWGIECVDLKENIWGIQFPPPSASEGGQSKALLECRQCSMVELMSVSLVEVEVLETSGILTKPCSNCGRETAWCLTEKQAAEAAGYKTVPKSAIIEMMLRGEDPETMSDTAIRYAHDLAFERISGIPYGEPPKTWLLQRGHELEDEARRLYMASTGYMVRECGICVDDDMFGYSTDGAVEVMQSNEHGLLEIKAPIDSVKITRIWRGNDLSEYQHQHQGGMWLTGRAWIDHVMYAPALESIGKHLYVRRIMRDDVFIDDMVRKLGKFQQYVQTVMHDLKK